MSQTADEFKALLDRINAATNETRDDIRKAISLIKPVMSQEEIDEIKAGLEASAVALEGVAAEFPVPEAPTE